MVGRSYEGRMFTKGKQCSYNRGLLYKSDGL
jgi:hypothetical protein